VKTITSVTTTVTISARGFGARVCSAFCRGQLMAMANSAKATGSKTTAAQ
jgi:hypothetical protein